MNQYRPWEDENITEVEYWKKRYLEERSRVNTLEQALLAVAVTPPEVVIGHIKEIEEKKDV